MKQKFRFFLRRIYRRYSRQITKWFRNCCALVNVYGDTGFTEDERNVSFASLALEMNKVKENRLYNHLVESGRLKCTATWRKMDGFDILDFPKLTLWELERYTVGTYQCEEALKYIRQHMKTNGNFEIRLHQELPGLVRTQIHSRFQSSAVHSLWVEYFPNRDGLDGITAHYCTCKNGARVVGCCAHVATVMRYMSFQRYCTEDVKVNVLNFWG